MTNKSEITPTTVWNLFTPETVKEWINIQDIRSSYSGSKEFAEDPHGFDDGFAKYIDQGIYALAAEVLAIQLLENDCLVMVDPDNWKICGSIRKTCDKLLVPNMLDRLIQLILAFEYERGNIVTEEI